MAIYNVLVWANDAGKFANDFSSKPKIFNLINKIWILGNEVRIEDLKLLNNLENQGVHIVIDEDVFGIKRDTELFILGKCADERENNNEFGDLGLVTYLAADKSVAEAAKKLKIPVVTWTNLCNQKPQITRQSSKNKNPDSKSNSLHKENSVKSNLATKQEKAETVKKATSTTKSISKTTTDVAKILKASKLPKETTSLLTSEIYEKIEKAINDASDPEIGLPMLLKMYCSFTESVSEQIAKAIAPNFKVLKSK